LTYILVDHSDLFKT